MSVKPLEPKEVEEAFISVDKNGSSKGRANLGATCREVAIVVLIFVISLLLFMNRYLTPPVVGRLKTAFQVEDMHIGLVQACFEICNIIFSPFFGYLGDRWKRCYVIAGGLLLAAGSGLLSSFVPESSFVAFLIARALVGVGEASYTNICPSVMGDLFVGRKRTIALTAYQIANPIGCGVGFIAASAVVNYTDDWRWAYRIIPLPMCVATVCFLLLIREPQRGEAERTTGQHRTTSFAADIAYLLRIPSFSLLNLANICFSFATSAISYWAPALFLRMLAMQGTLQENSESEIGLRFGLIAITAGISGVAIGVVASNFLKKHCGLASDGIVAGTGNLLAAPIVFAGLLTITETMLVTWILLYFGIVSVSCCLVLISEITLNVVVASRRSSAEAFQTAITHLFGDAASPYITGLISDQLRNAYYQHDGASSAMNLDAADFKALQTSLLLTTFITASAGGFFLYSSLYIDEDANKAKKAALNSKEIDNNAKQWTEI